MAHIQRRGSAALGDDPRPVTAPSWLEIDLARLEANLACFRALTAAAEPAHAHAGHASAGGVALAERPPLVCGVVKADAYGLGVGPIAQRLAARGVDMLAVYSAAQAEQLSGLSMTLPVLLLSQMCGLARTDPLYRFAVTNRLHLSLHDREQMLGLDHTGRMFGLKIPVHVYADSGMSRGGVGLDELAPLLDELLGMRYLRLAGVYTHLACSEGSAAGVDAQLAEFDRALEPFAGSLPADTIIHVANTCAALRDRRYHRGMVRVGLGMYGYGAEQLADPPADAALQPVVRWLAKVVHVRRYGRGATVGYGGTHRLNRESVLGLVPAGYADGYPLALSNRASVALPECSVDGRPALAPVVGRVNMDQVMIDLTDAPSAGIGSVVELISDDPASPCALPALAHLAGSSPYEMLCRLSPRLPRKYVS